MQTTKQMFLSSKDCPFTLGGTNLFELRRAKLQKIAAALGTPVRNESGVELAHTDVLAGIIGKLRQLEAPTEITELKSMQPKKKRAKKKK